MQQTPSTVSDYTKVDHIVREVIEMAQVYMTHMDPLLVEQEIWRAYIFSRNAHEGQFRKSGDPYILHPAEAAKILVTLKPDLVSIQSAFLHDVPEDTPTTVSEIEAVFGKEVAHIVSGMEKLSKVKYREEDRNVGSIRKMFIAMSEDLRVILVKFADRIHNMRTLEFHPNIEKRRRIALETLNIYAPIADRLGIFDFMEMLEGECFRILYPEEYAKIQSELQELSSEQEFFMHRAQNILREMIPEHIKVFEISSRIKSPYSIYKKMQRKGYESVKDLYDLFALRIITETIPNCYELLGIIHNHYTPVPKRFKDYIALPKPNGYQSLHTTVIGILQEYRRLPTEIQIRTLLMHKQAEIGVAAHFEYSESGKSHIAKDIYWVKELKSLLENTEDGELLGEMKTNVFDDRIFVFTPKGAVINLPKNATPVDFAYAIHSELGSKLAFAKVNGKMVPLDTSLHNGDRVEIVTDKSRHPSVTWLSFVKTSRAKEVIRSQINREQRETLIEKGRIMLSSYLENHFGQGLDKEMSILKFVDGRVLDTKGKEEVLLQIGNLSRKPVSVIRSLDADTLPAVRKKEEKTVKKAPKSTDGKEIAHAEHGFGELIIGGEVGIPYRFALCCHPEPGDKVVGYISKNVLSIHKVSCDFVKKGTLDRLIPATWSNQPMQTTRLEVDMVFQNKMGVLRKLTDIFFVMRINIEEIEQKSTPNRERVELRLTLSFDEEDYYLYERLIERIKLSIPEFVSSNLLVIQN